MANATPDLSSLDANPATPPPIWASQSFWIAVLGMIAPLIAMKFGVQINSAEIALIIATVLGMVAKHSFTLHTTNQTEIVSLKAKADTLQAHIEANASKDAATATVALADALTPPKPA